MVTRSLYAGRFSRLQDEALSAASADTRFNTGSRFLLAACIWRLLWRQHTALRMPNISAVFWMPVTETGIAVFILIVSTAEQRVPAISLDSCFARITGPSRWFFLFRMQICFSPAVRNQKNVWEYSKIPYFGKCMHNS